MEVLLCSDHFRVAVTGLRMPRLNFFVAGAVLSKHALENR